MGKFAHVAKMDTVRTLLAVTAAHGWELHHVDVHNAFLHGDLDEEVYMKLPSGYSTHDQIKVCKLRKSLYGLRQAPGCWFTKLTTAWKAYGFVRSYSDYSLFTYQQKGVHLSVLVYVDDLIIAGDDTRGVAELKTYLGNAFTRRI